MDPRPGSPPPRRSLLPLIVALAAFLLSILLATAFPLLDPDEGRNAEVAREMAVDGGLLVPHLAGMPYLDKPPALFWAAAAAIRVAGNEPWAARLPSALAAALTLALLTRSAQRRGGRPFALRAAALLYGAPLFAMLSAYVIFDMPLTLCVTAVWLGLAAEVAEGPSGRRRLWMFAAVTAGVLLKGPVMLAWALGGSLGAALLSRSRAPLRWLAWRPGWLVVLGVAGGWFALASARFPEYPRYAFLEESLERLTSGSFRREQPWWFAPAVLAAGALPWSLATPWWRRRTPGEESLLSVESRVGLGFVLFAVVFFSLSHSKLVTYLLPALPMLAWTAAEAWSDAERARRAAWGLAAVFVTLALASGIAGFGPWLGHAGPPLDSAAFGAKIIAACFAYVALRSLAAALGRPDRAFLGHPALHPRGALRRRRAAAALRRLAIGRATGARHHRHRARRLRALSGVLQSRHRFPAGTPLGAGERAWRRDHEHLPGPLPCHARRPRPVDAARRGAGLRSRGRPRAACARRPGAPGRLHGVLPRRPLRRVRAALGARARGRSPEGPGTDPENRKAGFRISW